MHISEKDLKRFNRFVKIDSENCWVWYGASVPTRKKGDLKRYGDFSVKGKPIRAHRFSYLAFKGKIESGQIDHVCRKTLCVNPDHLRLVTGKENTLSGIGPTAINARKLKCKRGHELVGSNLYLLPNGWRRCRKCQLVSERKYRARLVCIEEIEK